MGKFFKEGAASDKLTKAMKLVDDIDVTVPAYMLPQEASTSKKIKDAYEYMTAKNLVGSKLSKRSPQNKKDVNDAFARWKHRQEAIDGVTEPWVR